MATEELINAWAQNNRISLELLQLCPDDTFNLKPGSGKTIRSNFTHIVSVRMSWADPKGNNLIKLDWKSASREEIETALQASSLIVVEYLANLASSARPKKWTAEKMFAYLVAHEAHHRSQIELTLRLAGRELAESDMFALWDWNKS